MTANIETTIKCNLNCYMCTQRQLRAAPHCHDMSLAVFKRILNEHDDITHVSFIGGEPFLNKDFFAMMDFLEKKGATYEITTNGTLISQNFVSRLRKREGLKKINFSIDGLRTYHDKVRGKGVFEKCVHALRLLKGYQPVSVCSVAVKANLKQLPLFSILLAQMGINKHKIIYPVSISKKARQESKKMLPGLTIQGPLIKDMPKPRDILELFRVLERLQGKLAMSFEFEPAVAQKKPFIFFDKKPSPPFTCKQIKQYRFDCRGRRIVCEFIRNDFKPELRDHLAQRLLPICKWCCKLE